MTDFFDVLNGVQQGNPLAPLIFILFNDALHEGFTAPPVSVMNGSDRGGRCGYRFLDLDFTIASLGFADDLITFNESWHAQYVSHEWVLSFFSAHGCEINGGKTVYVISDAIPNDARWLRSTNGDLIRPSSPATTFKYLGIHVSMDLSWTEQIRVMNFLIMKWSGVVQRAKISAFKVFETYRTILLPKLDLGLIYARIPKKTCTRWSRLILRSIFLADGWPPNRTTALSVEAFLQVLLSFLSATGETSYLSWSMI